MYSVSYWCVFSDVVTVFISLLSDPGQVSTILSLMSSFQLPASAVPEWAKVVPEDVWKKELVGGLSGEVPASIQKARKRKKKKKKHKERESSEAEATVEPQKEPPQNGSASLQSPQGESQGEGAANAVAGNEFSAMGAMRSRRRKLSFGDEEDLCRELGVTLTCNGADESEDSRTLEHDDKS